MIVLGVVLAILGYWLLPGYVPEVPARIDGLMGIVGVILIIAGIVLFVWCRFRGPVGGRTRWY